MVIATKAYDFNHHPGRKSTSKGLVGDPELRKKADQSVMDGYAPNTIAVLITEPYNPPK